MRCRMGHVNEDCTCSEDEVSNYRTHGTIWLTAGLVFAIVVAAVLANMWGA